MSERDNEKKLIVYKWIEPTLRKVEEELQKAQEAYASKQFKTSQERENSSEYEKYNRLYEIRVVLNDVYNGQTQRVAVNGLIGAPFMETVYQSLVDGNVRIPKHYFEDDSLGISDDLQDGYLDLLAFVQEYVATEGAEFLDKKPLNTPKDEDPNTYTYKKGIAKYTEGSGIDLKKYSIVQNPIKWYKTLPYSVRSISKISVGVVLIVLLANFVRKKVYSV